MVYNQIVTWTAFAILAMFVVAYMKEIYHYFAVITAMAVYYIVHTLQFDVKSVTKMSGEGYPGCHVSESEQ